MKPKLGLLLLALAACAHAETGEVRLARQFGVCGCQQGVGLRGAGVAQQPAGLDHRAGVSLFRSP